VLTRGAGMALHNGKFDSDARGAGDN